MPSNNREPLPPEAVNPEQEDESAQSQSVAQEALNRATAPFGLVDSDKMTNDDAEDAVEDLVDHMCQMETSGIIDMSAFRGERNDDEEEGRFGNGAEAE